MCDYLCTHSCITHTSTSKATHPLTPCHTHLCHAHPCPIPTFILSSSLCRNSPSRMAEVGRLQLLAHSMTKENHSRCSSSGTLHLHQWRGRETFKHTHTQQSQLHKHCTHFHSPTNTLTQVSAAHVAKLLQNVSNSV